MPQKHLQPALNVKSATKPNPKQLNSAKPNFTQPDYKYTTITKAILDIPNTTITTHYLIFPNVKSSMHLYCCINAPCGSIPLETSAGYQLLELDVDFNGTPSVSLIDSGASK